MVVTGLLLLPGSLTPTGDAPGETQAVVVAARDLPAGTVISVDDLTSADVPSSMADRGVVDPVGRTVVADIFKAEPVDPRRVAPGGVGATAALMPVGTSAVAVPVIGALPPLEVGDLVDVYDTQIGLITGDPGGADRAVAVGATVVAVDEERVTIAVDPDEVAEVATSAGNGAVTLALRPGDPPAVSAGPEPGR